MLCFGLTTMSRHLAPSAIDLPFELHGLAHRLQQLHARGCAPIHNIKASTRDIAAANQLKSYGPSIRIDQTEYA